MGTRPSEWMQSEAKNTFCGSAALTCAWRFYQLHHRPIAAGRLRLEGDRSRMGRVSGKRVAPGVRPRPTAAFSFPDADYIP